MLSDSFGRKIEYLRISVTDRCNLRCAYCVPWTGISLKPRSEILSFEEIKIVVNAMLSLGTTKFKVTGGEPLVREGIASLIEFLSNNSKVKDCSMTTNGILLAKFADELKRSGLNRLNISLDTLSGEKYKTITRGGNIDDVLKGIEKSLSVGIKTIKINVVLIKGFNENELLDFLKLSLTNNLHIRFIEYMPMGNIMGYDKFMSNGEVKNIIEENSGMLQQTNVIGSGPAKYFKLQGARGSVGFISPISAKFCEDCNRVRLTPDGKLIFCLCSEQGIELKNIIREGVGKEELANFIKMNIAKKPKEHNFYEAKPCSPYVMSQLGG